MPVSPILPGLFIRSGQFNLFNRFFFRAGLFLSRPDYLAQLITSNIRTMANAIRITFWNSLSCF